MGVPRQCQPQVDETSVTQLSRGIRVGGVTVGNYLITPIEVPNVKMTEFDLAKLSPSEPIKRRP